jgi:hypothetical protein
MNFAALDFTSRWYKNCKQQRKKAAKICGDCPFRAEIEQEEQRRELANEAPRAEQSFILPCHPRKAPVRHYKSHLIVPAPPEIVDSNIVPFISHTDNPHPPYL